MLRTYGLLAVQQEAGNYGTVHYEVAKKRPGFLVITSDHQCHLTRPWRR